jgi:hypothetical protein
MGFGKVVKKATKSVGKVGKVAGKVGKAQVNAAKRSQKNLIKTVKNTTKAAAKGDIKGIAKGVKGGLSEQNSIRKKNFHETMKPISENKLTDFVAQAAASYFGGPLGGAAYGAASGYEKSGGNWGSAALGGGLGYLGGKGMQNAGFTYGQNGMTNLMNGTVGTASSLAQGGGANNYVGADGLIHTAYQSGASVGPNALTGAGGMSLAGGGGATSSFLGSLGNMAPGLIGNSAGAYDSASNAYDAYSGASQGSGGGGEGGGTDWGSLLGQLGSGYLNGVGVDAGAKAYQDTINQGINYGKGQGDIQGIYANQVPGQIAAYLPATQGQVAYEQGTPNNPYTAQASAYGQQLSDILSGKSDWKTDPGYAFRMQQGQQETERNAASRGYNQSGNIMAALQDRAQGTASQEYQNITERLKGLQDQYANQDINAQSVSSGDRRNNASNRTSFIGDMLGNQVQYRTNQGALGNGIMNMYADRAGADEAEDSAGYLAGGSTLGSIFSNPTGGRNPTGGGNGISNAISAGRDVYSAGSDIWKGISDWWNS